MRLFRDYYLPILTIDPGEAAFLDIEFCWARFWSESELTPTILEISFWKLIFSYLCTSVILSLPGTSILLVELSDITKLCFLRSSKKLSFSFCC
jgi:hypothetical protein